LKKGFLIVTLTMVLLLLTVTYAHAESAVLVGYGVDDQLTLSGSGVDTTVDVTSKVSLAYEYTLGGSGLKNGFGFQYQMPKTAENETGEKFEFQNIPVYGIISLGVAETEITNTYLIGKLGYNYFKADLEEGLDDKGGLYYAAGLEIKIGPNFMTQLLYEVYNGEISSGIAKIDVENKVYSVKCGLTF
jgi:hypothetical protein